MKRASTCVTKFPQKIVGVAIRRTLVCGIACCTLVSSAGILCSCKTAATPREAIQAARSPQSCPTFDAATGASITWDELLLRVRAADAVFVGETHDDAVAHKAQHALVAAFLDAHPRGAVSLEMLERDDQDEVDAYLAGRMTLDEFIDATNSRDWAGEDSWLPWYQPSIDAARVRGATVIAANAPRRFVSQAFREGPDSLTTLPPEERALFDADVALTRDGDWERLRELMIEMRTDASKNADAAVDPPTDAEVDAVHRSQRVWDLTMGTSLARAWSSGTPFIHLVGAFHVQRRLGTAAIFMRLCPNARVLVVQLDPADTLPPKPEWNAGADVTVMTKAQAPTQQPTQ